MKTGIAAVIVGLLFTGCVVVPPPDTTPPDPSPPKPHPGPHDSATATAKPNPPAATTDPDARPPITLPTAGQTCGSRGLGPCPADHFCDFPAGSECGATDRGGTCTPTPQMCTRELNPVCGCDGQTYPTACVAHTKGVSVSKPGKCI